jgi:hypothetical protein
MNRTRSAEIDIQKLLSAATRDVMSPSELVATYRLYAAHCIEIARETSRPGSKVALLNMAQAWLALADLIARGGSRRTFPITHPHPKKKSTDQRPQSSSASRFTRRARSDF